MQWLGKQCTIVPTEIALFVYTFLCLRWAKAEV